MSNEETLQEYNTNLSGNNEALRGVLNMINELPDADLTGYATIEYVDEAIANAGIGGGSGDVDLSNVLTKDNTEEFTPDGDYEPATKKYVDDENKGLVILEQLKFGQQVGNGYGITDAIILNKILNGILKGGNYYPAFLGVGTSGKQVLFAFATSYTTNQYKVFTYIGTTPLNEKTNTNEVHKLTFTINGMGYVNNNTKTISDVSTSFSHINRSLNTDNTISYTPTANYHPATKKYVDDVVANISGSGSSIVYSTEEIVVGTWIDGKPIYRKTVTIELDNTANSVNAPHGILDLDSVINYEAFFKEGTSTRFLPQFYYDMSATYAINVYLIGQELVQIVYGEWAKNIKPTIYMTLTYTKTTDTGTEVE